MFITAIGTSDVVVGGRMLAFLGKVNGLSGVLLLLVCISSDGVVVWSMSFAADLSGVLLTVFTDVVFWGVSFTFEGRVFGFPDMEDLSGVSCIMFG